MWVRLFFLAVGLFSGYLISEAAHREQLIELRPTIVEQPVALSSSDHGSDSYAYDSYSAGPINCLEGVEAIKKVEADAREYDSYSVFQGKVFLTIGDRQTPNELGHGQSYGFDNACALLPIGSALPMKIKVVDGKPVAAN